MYRTADLEVSPQESHTLLSSLASKDLEGCNSIQDCISSVYFTIVYWKNMNYIDHFVQLLVYITIHTYTFLNTYLYLQTLLELGASPNYKDSCGLTPLYHTAVVGGDPYCCELLLHEHAIVGCKDENGWQEIHQVGKDF